MLEFGSHGDAKPVRQKRNFVLKEAAVETRVEMPGKEREHSRVADVIVGISEPQPPKNALGIRQRKPVLEIGVIGVEIVAEHTRDLPVRFVEVRLDRQIRTL